MTPPAIARIVITCEHAGNRVPAAYAECFRSLRARRALASHRGHDPGAARAARHIARHLGVSPLMWMTTRLLVEVNRSIDHPRLFSEFCRPSDPAERDELLARCYTPHRERVIAAVAEAARGGRLVLHVGVHSFVPRLGGKTRNSDVGLLYDPARALERNLCLRWQRALQRDGAGDAGASGLRPRVRRNYPYRGAADGLTTTLRRLFPPSRYLGIELEISQARLIGRDAGDVSRLLRALSRSLDEAIRG